ncbi:ubiquitin-protein ligase [Mrakia frigida]|uniref:SKP1 family protein n=1 Tax=Mrakia frigida TaxID=29902 RepID=UPI003FCBEE56
MAAAQVVLRSSDGITFSVDKEVAERSVLLKNMLEDLGDDLSQAIPLVNIKEAVLKKVLEFCEHHRADFAQTETAYDVHQNRSRCTDLSEWDASFISVDQQMLFDLILAANYLDIEALLHVGCKTVAILIANKDHTQIREIFHIPIEFTLEEEAQIIKENEWGESITGRPKRK